MKTNKTYQWFKGILLVTLTSFAPLAHAQNWNLVWADEFNGSIGPDWVFETGAGGWGNNELQYYRQQNASIENGQLVITAKNESFGGMNYTSARMKTQGKKSWKYGKMEARIAMPAFSGIWPAFWMLGDNIGSVGWPSCGEIDIMEHVNAESTTYGTIHWQDHTNNYASYGGNTGVSVTQYHLYTIEWDANAIKWFVDGNLFHQASIAGGVNGTSEFHNNFFILLNMAVGGNWPGFNINNGALPAKMYVDYVRVYQNGGSNAWTTQIEAENWTVQAGTQNENCSEGGQNVGYIDANDWMVWDVNLPSNGSYLVQYRVASQNGGGALQLEKAGGSPVYGSLNLPNTGGWQNWTTVSHYVNMSAGQQQIAIKALAGGWNINWIKITKNGSARMLDETVSVDEISDQQLIQVYPNPAQNQLTVKVANDDELISLQIHDMTGRTVLNLAPNQGLEQSFDISKLQTGNYIMQIKTRLGVQSTKIVKQ